MFLGVCGMQQMYQKERIAIAGLWRCTLAEVPLMSATPYTHVVERTGLAILRSYSISAIPIIHVFGPHLAASEEDTGQ
jgi:hypothetical protein